MLGAAMKEQAQERGGIETRCRETCLLLAVLLAGGVGVTRGRARAAEPTGPPAFLEHPTNQTVRLGAGVTNRVSLGPNPAALQWFTRREVMVSSIPAAPSNADRPARGKAPPPLPSPPWRPVAGATNEEFVIRQFTNREPMAFHAVASNAFGLATSRVAVITVEAPPVIHRHPQPQGLRAGKEVRLEVVAGGSGPLGYVWQLHGTNSIYTRNAPLLVLSNLPLAQTGPYRVIVSNRFGLATSREAQVALLEPPVVTPAYTLVSGGAGFALQGTTNGTPPVSYQWFRQGVPLAGQTTAVLRVTNARIADSGRYRLWASNLAGVARSAPAVVVLETNRISAPDAYAGRLALQGERGTVTADNYKATREPGEPNHPDVPSGNSVWFVWQPPGPGRVTFDTTGSTFDTLLAAYREPPQGALPTAGDLRDADDDSAGFGASRLQFNTRRPERYVIAVDGARGATGQFHLNWSWSKDGSLTLPHRRSLRSQTVQPNREARFEVQGGTNVSYRWFHFGQELRGKTNASLVISNVRPQDVGEYTMAACAPLSGSNLQTATARLEIGPVAGVQSSDKVLLTLGDAGGAKPAALARAAGISVSAGSTGSQIFSLARCDSPGGTNGCQWTGEQTRMLTLSVAAPGRLSVNTTGSLVSTFLRVWRGLGADFMSYTNVACATTNEADGRACSLQLDVSPGLDYALLVDALGSPWTTNCLVFLNWSLLPALRVEADRPARRLQLEWLEADSPPAFRLEYADAVAPGPAAQWRPWSGAVTTAEGTNRVTVPLDAPPRRFFRLTR